MAPGTDISMDAPLAGAVLRNGLFATKIGVEAERDCILEVSNCYRIEKEQ